MTKICHNRWGNILRQAEILAVSTYALSLHVQRCKNKIIDGFFTVFGSTQSNKSFTSKLKIL